MPKQNQTGRFLGKETAFAQKVYAEVAKIPRGETRTYAVIAKCVGHPGAARAVGTILSQNRDSRVPCHRVIRSDGHAGGYAFGGATKKKAILRREGARVL